MIVYNRCVTALFDQNAINRSAIQLPFVKFITMHSNPLSFQKENSLSFHNITQTMKINKSKHDGSCYYHPDKKAKYIDRETDLLYCYFCAIQEASRGSRVYQLVPKDPSRGGTLQGAYEQAQAEIQKQIKSYNDYFGRLNELITDMQIKDLLTFNRKLEENHNIFEQLKKDTNLHFHTNFKDIFKSEKTGNVISKIEGFVREIEGFKDAQFTHSFHKEINEVSPFHHKIRSQYLIPKKEKELKIVASSNSLHEESKHNHLALCSKESFAKTYASKNSSTVEQLKKSCEDTPESLKNQTMKNNGIRVTGEMATTMFEKIDVCESIDISKQSSGADRERSSFSSLKSRYRYEAQQ